MTDEENTSKDWFNMDDKKEKMGEWFNDVVRNFMPNDIDIQDKTPKQLMNKSAWQAFGSSTLAGLPPGPIGMTTIIPELLVVTKIQVNLVYAIAKYYKKQNMLNDSMILLIFSNALGLGLGKDFVKKYGGKLLIKVLHSEAIQKIATRIGLEIVSRITAKAAGRWVPVVLAPVFGAMSRAFTRKIGREAIRLFKADIVLVQAKACSNGHENFDDAKFCSQCGEKL